MKSYGPEEQPRSRTTWQLLEANPARAETIDTELVACGVAVKRLLRAGPDRRATNGAQAGEVTLRMEG